MAQEWPLLTDARGRIAVYTADVIRTADLYSAAVVLRLRRGEAADLAEIVALEQASDTREWLGETGLAWHERAAADPDQEPLIAVQPPGLIGFAVLAGLTDADHVIELRRMVVSPACRGAGNGRKLLRAAVARAYEQHHARGVWLDVKTGNTRARSLYESEGFVIAPAPAGDGTPDLIVMEYRPVESAG